IAHLEPGRFGRGYDVVRGSELSVGEDVGVDEHVSLPELLENLFAHRFRTRLSEADNAVIEKQSAGLQRAERRREVNRQVAEANVLDHPNAGDLVVAVTLRERAVVADRNATLIGEPGLRDPLLCQRRLIFAE